MRREGGARISWPARTGSRAQQLRKVFLLTSDQVKLTTTCFPADGHFIPHISLTYRGVDGPPGGRRLLNRRNGSGAALSRFKSCCGDSLSPVSTSCSTSSPDALHPNKPPPPQNKTNVPEWSRAPALNYPSIRGDESRFNLRLIANESVQTRARTFQSYLTRAQPRRGPPSAAGTRIDPFFFFDRSMIDRFVVCGVRSFLRETMYSKVFLRKPIERSSFLCGAKFNIRLTKV